MIDAAGNTLDKAAVVAAAALWGDFAPPDLQSPSEQVNNEIVYADAHKADIYGMLQQGLRDIDRLAGSDFLARFVFRMEMLWERFQQKQARLAVVDSPSEVPSDLLDALLALVGFGPNSPNSGIAKGLSDTAKRKLASVAVPMWKEKGRRDALVDISRFVTGRRPLIYEWHEVTGAIDESYLGSYVGVGNTFILTAPYVTTLPTLVTDADAGEHHLFLRVPGADLSSDEKNLLTDLIGIVRLANEFYEVAFVDFVDNFIDGLMPWWVLSGTPTWQKYTTATIPATAVDPAIEVFVPNGIQMPPGSGVELDFLDSATWGAQTASFYTSFYDGADAKVNVDLAYTAAASYQIRLGGGTLAVYEMAAGIPTLLGSIPMTYGASAYRWDVLFEIVEQPAGTPKAHIRVEFDGPDDFIDVLAAAPVTVQGPIKISHNGGADSFVVHRVEVAQIPLDARLVKA